MAQPLWRVKPPFEPGVVWVGPNSAAKANGIWIGTLGELVSGPVPAVWLSSEKEQVIAVVGKRGSGKSFTLGVLCEGLTLEPLPAHVGIQSKPRAVLLFDPLDIYWTAALSVKASTNPEVQRHYQLAASARLENLRCNVQAWIPGERNRRGTDPAWFKTLQLPVNAIGLEEWELLLGVSVLLDPMGQALADAILLVRKTGFTKSGTFVAPTLRFGIDALIAAVDSAEIATAYHSETLRALRQRLNSLDATGLFAIDGVDVAALLAPGRLTVILLGRLPQSYRAAVIATLTRMVVDNRSDGSFVEKRLFLDNTLTDEERERLKDTARAAIPHVLIALDEAQTVLAPGPSDPAKEVFVRLVKEGRNLGLSVALATQQPSAIDQKVLSQVETFIAHQLVTEPDIRAVRENLKSALPESIEFGKQELDFSALLRSLAPGQCIVSAADSNLRHKRLFIMSVRPRATVHGGIEL
jgi:uncharacterized protein